MRSNKQIIRAIIFICVIVSVIVIIPTLIIAGKSVPAADDYSNSIFFRASWDAYKSPFIASLAESAGLYKTTSGYYFAAFLNCFCSPFLRHGIQGLRAFNLLTSLFFYFSALILCRAFSAGALKDARRVFTWVVFASFVIMIVNGHKNSEVYTWYVVLVAYVLPLAFMLLTFAALIQASEKKKILYILAAAGAFLVSGSSLNVTALNCGMLFIITVYYFASGEKKKGSAIVFLFSLIGAIINVASPGNYIRHDEAASEYGLTDTLLYTAKLTAKMIAERITGSLFLAVLFVVFIAALYLFDYSGRKIRFNHPVIAAVIVFAGVSIVNFPVCLGYANQYFPDRCIFTQDLTIYLLSFLWIVYFAGWIKTETRLFSGASHKKQMICTVLIMAAACSVPLLINGALWKMPTIEMMRSITSHDLDRYVEYEEGIIAEISGSPDKDVVLTRPEQITNDFCKDIGITDNTAYWVNVYVAQYYGKDSVSLIIDSQSN